MKYLNKFDTKSDYQASASTLEIPNVAYITASTEVIYNATQPKAYVVFADQAVGRKCVLLYSSDGVGCTEEDLAAVTYLNPNDWKGTQSNPTTYTSFDELRYFTGINSISSEGFGYSTSLTSVTIPESVTFIGNYAFYESPLESITFMSATPPYLGRDVFHDRAATGNLTVPANGEGNYYDLAVSLGNGWTINGHAPVRYVAFEDPLVASKCATLYGDGTGCTMEDISAVTSLNPNDWSGTPITSFNELQYFTGITGIGGVFKGCTDLTSVTIPDSVTAISQTFADCTSLTSIELPDNVGAIYPSTFSGCTALERVTFSLSLQLIDDDSFRGCSSLSNLTFVADTKPTTIMYGAFHGLPNTGTLMVPSGSASNYQSIAQSLGQGWALTEYIVFSDPVVGQKCATLYGDGYVCTEADLGAVTSLNRDDWRSTSQQYPTPYTSFDELRYFTAITSIPEDCFGYSTSLTSVTIPSAVTEISKWAFYDSPLESITFMSTTPPTLGQDPFHEQAASGNITVPVGSESNFYSLAQSLGSGWTVNGQTPS